MTERLHLLVRDDGVGFDVDVACAGVADGTSSGLLGMRERVQLVGGHVLGNLGGWQWYRSACGVSGCARRCAGGRKN